MERALSAFKCCPLYARLKEIFVYGETTVANGNIQLCQEKKGSAWLYECIKTVGFIYDI